MQLATACTCGIASDGSFARVQCQTQPRRDGGRQRPMALVNDALASTTSVNYPSGSGAQELDPLQTLAPSGTRSMSGRVARLATTMGTQEGPGALKEREEQPW